MLPWEFPSQSFGTPHQSSARSVVPSPWNFPCSKWERRILQSESSKLSSIGLFRWFPNISWARCCLQPYLCLLSKKLSNVNRPLPFHLRKTLAAWARDTQFKVWLTCLLHQAWVGYYWLERDVRQFQTNWCFSHTWTCHNIPPFFFLPALRSWSWVPLPPSFAAPLIFY